MITGEGECLLEADDEGEFNGGFNGSVLALDAPARVVTICSPRESFEKSSADMEKCSDRACLASKRLRDSIYDSIHAAFRDDSCEGRGTQMVTTLYQAVDSATEGEYLTPQSRFVISRVASEGPETGHWVDG